MALLSINSPLQDNKSINGPLRGSYSIKALFRATSQWMAFFRAPISVKSLPHGSLSINNPLQDSFFNQRSPSELVANQWPSSRPSFESVARFRTAIQSTTLFRTPVSIDGPLQVSCSITALLRAPRTSNGTPQGISINQRHSSGHLYQFPALFRAPL